MRVAIVGSSHVRRMDHVNEFIPGTTLTRYFWKSGGKVEDIYRFIADLQTFRPNLIFLQIGGNDIDINTCPERLAHDIYTLCQRLLSSVEGLERVYVGSLFLRLRTRGVPFDHYDQMRRRVNECLGRQSCSCIVYWRHQRIVPACLDDDQVHLNVRGNKQLYMSMRGALKGFITFGFNHNPH